MQFRKYVKGRIDVEPTLAAFLAAQEVYFQRLQELKGASSGKEFIFSDFDLDQVCPRQIKVKHQQIILEG